ncbi:MAG: hypothetical protein WDW36_003494 [Sanguina aurantia]
MDTRPAPPPEPTAPTRAGGSRRLAALQQLAGGTATAEGEACGAVQLHRGGEPAYGHAPVSDSSRTAMRAAGDHPRGQRRVFC